MKTLRLEPGGKACSPPGEIHSFSNETDSPPTVRVTATPSGDIERALRTVASATIDRNHRDPVLLKQRAPHAIHILSNSSRMPELLIEPLKLPGPDLPDQVLNVQPSCTYPARWEITKAPDLRFRRSGAVSCWWAILGSNE